MKKQLLIITLLTAAAQLAAFFKLWFTAQILGVGNELDGYNLALILPTLISGVLAGLLQTGLFPIRARLNRLTPEQQTEAFERTILWGSFLVSTLISLLISINTSWLVPAIGHDTTNAVRAALAFAMPYMAILVALNIAGDCTSYLLAMRGQFTIAAAASIINGLLSSTMLALWPENGLFTLVLSTLLGLVAQVTICLYSLVWHGFSIFGSLPQWKVIQPLLVETIKLGAWILPGVVFSNIIIALPPLWMAEFGEGSISAFGYAYRLHSLVIQLLVMASSTFILTSFANFVAEKNYTAIRHILQKATLAALIIGLSSTIAVWILGAPLLQSLFKWHLDSKAAISVAFHWFWLTIGLGFIILGNVFSRLWQAQGRPQLLSILL